MARLYLLPEDAEDVVQDVLTSLWEKRDALAFIEFPLAYAFSSVKNKCLDHVKHEAYKREYCRRTLATMKMDIELEEQNNYSVVSDELEGKEMEARLSRAISELPPRCRTIFQLRQLKGKHYAEISDMLGITVNTVDCQLNIAQRRLRKSLKVS